MSCLLVICLLGICATTKLDFYSCAPAVCQAVFRRRKNGLLRRAMELSVMADCDVAVLVFHGTTGAAPRAAA
jgi:hypothetical protein